MEKVMVTQSSAVTSLYRVPLAIVVIAVVLSGTAQLAVAQDDVELDVVWLNDRAPGFVTGGQVVEQGVEGVVYRAPGRPAQTFYPWQIEMIRFGYAGLRDSDNYDQGLAALRKGSYANAIERFDDLFESLVNNADAWREVRPYRRRDEGDRDEAALLYSLGYFRALGHLELGAAIERAGRAALNDVQAAFALDLTAEMRARREREFTGDPARLADAKARVSAQINALVAAIDGLDADDADVTEVREAIADTASAEDLEEVIRGAFTQLFKSRSAPFFERAVELLNGVYDLAPRRWDYSRVKPVWIYHIKTGIARALAGLGRYGEALGHLGSAFENVVLPDGRRQPIAAVSPNLIDELQPLVSRNPVYHAGLVRVRFLAAQIYEQAQDFVHVRGVYRDIVQNTPKEEQFAAKINEANLAWAVALSRGEQGSYERAEGKLLPIIERFRIDAFRNNSVTPGFSDSATMSTDEVALYAGAFNALGHIAYTEFLRGRASRYRQAALDNFLRVSSLLAADADKRAEALYWAARLYNEIAEDELADDYKEMPKIIPRDDGSTRPNPYHYYLDAAGRLARELRENYPESDWTALLESGDEE
jgi:hypothetical protein